MVHINNALLIRRELITRVGRLMIQGKLEEEIDRIPLEMFPRGKKSLRCCIHKERAVLRYKLMALLGFDTSQEKDELTPLSEYAHQALLRDDKVENVLTVVDEACSSCVKSNYVVTNVCRGCVARPCMLNCPKDAISLVDGRAHIDQDKCVNCGLCQKECPYHAIIFQPVPCEEACPVGAIRKDEDGVEQIDEEKCIHCGRCMVACPFGAVNEKPQVVDVMKHILNADQTVVAMVAPSLIGQFNAEFGQILTAIKKLGFDTVYEVAEGAVITARKEAEELEERMEEGAPFMTSSCCPAYVDTVAKHLPQLSPFVSDTRTPMHYTAQLARKRRPGAKTVFIGPCIAKRNEALKDECVDYVMTFEELGALFIAAGIDVMKMEPSYVDNELSDTGRWFASSGGVSKAICHCMEDENMVKPVSIDGLNKKNINQLKGFAKGKCPGNLVEVMACEGGCVNGAGVISSPAMANRLMTKFFKRDDKGVA